MPDTDTVHDRLVAQPLPFGHDGPGWFAATANPNRFGALYLYGDADHGYAVGQVGFPGAPVATVDDTVTLDALYTIVEFGDVDYYLTIAALRNQIEFDRRFRAHVWYDSTLARQAFADPKTRIKPRRLRRLLSRAEYELSRLLPDDVATYTARCYLRVWSRDIPVTAGPDATAAIVVDGGTTPPSATFDGHLLRWDARLRRNERPGWTATSPPAVGKGYRGNQESTEGEGLLPVTGIGGDTDESVRVTVADPDGPTTLTVNYEWDEQVALWKAA